MIQHVSGSRGHGIAFVGNYLPRKFGIAAIAKATIDLFDDEVALSGMRKRAYSHCRNMVWSAVSRSYLNVFDEVRSHSPADNLFAVKASGLLGPTDLPTPKSDYLLEPSDDTGFAHHALRRLPDWRHGYWLAAPLMNRRRNARAELTRSF